METTMFEVGVVAQFEAAHRLHGEFGPATRRHGHTYRVEVAVRGPALHGDGTLCDIGRLQQAVQDVVSSLHYRDLDELAAFEGRNSTAEVVAQYLFEQIAPRFTDQGLSVLVARVWESPQAYASFEGALG
jgi:6-pyruvoyltetrahydropterin/6-carboxytetrahydropterin synthase